MKYEKKSKTKKNKVKQVGNIMLNKLFTNKNAMHIIIILLFNINKC